jgi:hypothetical protein
MTDREVLSIPSRLSLKQLLNCEILYLGCRLYVGYIYIYTDKEFASHIMLCMFTDSHFTN